MDRQEFSSLVSLALNSMGYSYETVRERQRLYNVDCFKDRPENYFVHVHLVGSMAEGVSRIGPPSNDVDLMGVLGDTVVFEDTPKTYSCKDEDFELQMECENVAPGYATIKCVNIKSSNISQRPGLNKFNVVERNDCYYLQHSLKEIFYDELRESQTRNNQNTEREGETYSCDISGPAATLILKNTSPIHNSEASVDTVFAIPCLCSSHIKNWVSRTNYCEWPDRELLSKIKNQIGYLVPVGVKGSKNVELEWRICYTLLENILIRSLNETQLKMYVLLKMVAKTILKPICKDITSYVIKNLVLWIVERNAKEIFTPENLTSLVMLGLRSLRNKVDIRLFGSYMIPERNIFAEKITEHEKIETVRILDEMLAQGPMSLVNFKELNRLKMAIDETKIYPTLAEMKTKLQHALSLLPLFVKTPERYELLYVKIFAGTILVAKDSELDELQKKKLKDRFLKTENTYGGDRDDFGKDIVEMIYSHFESVDAFLSAFFEFYALQ